MHTKDHGTELNNTSIFILLLLRVVVLLFSIMLALKTDRWLNHFRDVVLLGFGVYQTLAVCMFLPGMKYNITRLLLSASDLFIITSIVLMTGGVASPFILCSIIPIFAMHYIYGWKGMVGGLAGLAVSTIICLKASNGLLYMGIGQSNTDLIVLGTGIIIFYLVPFSAFSQYARMDNKLRSLKEKYYEMDTMNSKLLVLYEMTGRFNYENGIAHVMDRLLTLCKEIFAAESVCVFLIRSGEVEIYGRPSAQEKEDIYRLIMEQKKNAPIKEESSEYIIREDALVIPLIRGARTDGVLSFNGWRQQEITGREAILLSMIANMVCTYLENLEYVESLKSKLMPDTIVMMNQLDSGKPVKGILDKRIISGKLK